MVPEYENIDLTAMNEIIPGLWLGDLRSALDTQSLRDKNIHSVLSVMRGTVTVSQTFNRLQISLDDTDEEDILKHLVTCISFIQAELDKERGVLVHCLAGISRSVSIVAAYLMYTQGLSPDDTLNLIRTSRPIADPNPGFITQLRIFHKASCKVSKHDKAIRMFYLERMVKNMTNGDGKLDEDVLVQYPASSLESSPTTPATPNRRIRCKMCRQELASREHMVDHGQFSPPTPAVSYSPTIPPTSLLAGPSRMSSAKNSSPVISPSPNDIEEAVKFGDTISRSISDSKASQATPPFTNLQTQAVSLSNSRPPMARPTKTPSISVNGVPHPPNPSAQLAHPSDISAELSSNPKIAALKSGLSVIPAPSPSLNSPRASSILANTKCSGYFVEPLKWMETFLENGQMSGKIMCPNKKCGTKLGNYDWAGVCCSCKEWVVPGFCIARSKVDEIA